MKQPKLLVFASLFPSTKRPTAGIFIRERMFMVGQQLPIVVVSPVPWFPLQGLIRKWKPNYRIQPDYHEIQQGIDVFFPKFFSFPGVLRSLDGFFMALGSLPTLLKLKSKFNIIDSHFAYPDGYAATLLGRWLSVPVTITLRGTEVPLSKIPARRARIICALKNASRIFSVADSLRQHMANLGADATKIRVVGNGVNTSKFFPVDKATARMELKISETAKVLVSVGGLVDRKGFHRVIEVLPQLVAQYPDLLYLIVGGASPEGDIRTRLEEQVKSLNLENHVQFLGSYVSEQLKSPLSAADVFVLATANEGWANVFLEAMACGLPVITTDVGGNREVVNAKHLGTVVPFGEPEALLSALVDALAKAWDKQAIIDYAKANAWDTRVEILVEEFQKLVN